MRLTAVGAIFSLGTFATIAWTPFSSALYPYTVSQPSSYRHVVLQDSAGHNADYFFPSLGSYTTNVSIYAEPGRTIGNDAAYLRSTGGKHVHKSGTFSIASQQVPILHADFHGLAGNWSVDRICFQTQGMVWYLTASYDQRYRRLLPLLMRMLHSFRLR